MFAMQPAAIGGVEDVAVRRLDAAGEKARRHGEISSP
jgi:hypothetical protein